jgi:hypothetical protein
MPALPLLPLERPSSAARVPQIEDEDDDDYDWLSPRSARWRFLLPERINQEGNSDQEHKER